MTKTNSYYVIKCRFLHTIILSTCLLLVSCKHSNSHDTSIFIQIEQLNYSNPEEALDLLEQMPYDSLSNEEQMRWNLEHEHLLAKLYLPTSPDSIMKKVINYYQKKDDQSNLAKAYYVQGLEYYLQTDYYEAMQAVKEAEARIDLITDTVFKSALIFHLEGMIAESDELYYIANRIYKRALPYAIQQYDSLRLACFYRDIASTEYNDSLEQSYYQLALDIAQKINNQVLFYDIRIQQENGRIKHDSIKLYELSKFMTDSLREHRYACYVADYLMQHYQLKEAKQYLSIFAKDTTLFPIIANQYYYYESIYQAKSGNIEVAYNQLRHLYLQLRSQIETDAKSRTYTISRMYDVEQEKNRNLELTLAKNRLWIGFGCTIVILFVIIGITLFINHLAKERERKLQQEKVLRRIEAELAQSKIDILNTELESKRNSLKQDLQQRIELTRRIRKSSQDTISEMPQWLQEWIEENTFSNEKSWKSFMDSFNNAFENLLPRIKKEYPALTERDLQYIALAILNMDINDICYLLGTTERTMWNRRQFIKNHIGDSKMDLDGWIRGQLKG